MKKTLLVLALLISYAPARALNDETLKTLKAVGGVTVLGAVAAGGNYADKLNSEYEQLNKNPDLKMRLVKSGGMVLMGTVIEHLFFKEDGEKTAVVAWRNLAKIGALTAATLFATSETVENIAREIPLVRGFLTDPKGTRDLGMINRFALAWLVTRSLALNMIEPK
ncbi:hypothetical protein Noda2021_00110 [Candidatus Dependentiae bacterium Noda2021]|nr:hypothetical protein Noda2021_00110 [Candidatus Dependentiae bacterium Noda2021]